VGVRTGVPAEPETVAAAVRSCRSVVRLSGGHASEVATYLPGRRVLGVRFADGRVEVRVVGVYGPTVGEIAAEVTAAVAPLVGGRTVDVVVDDLEPPGRTDAPAPTTLDTHRNDRAHVRAAGSSR
jgi:hypothetical protein